MSYTKHILCLSTSSFEQHKIYTTDKQPEEELAEVNERGDVPEPYVMIDCLMDCSREKVERVFAVLSEYQYKGVFYRPWENLKDLFALLREQVPTEVPAQVLAQDSSDEEPIRRKPNGPHLSSYAFDGQEISHKNCCTTVWLGKYDGESRKIIHDGKFYNTLSGFGRAHHQAENNTKRPSCLGNGGCNGPEECEMKKPDGSWDKANTLFPPSST